MQFKTSDDIIINPNPTHMFQGSLSLNITATLDWGRSFTVAEVCGFRIALVSIRLYFCIHLPYSLSSNINSNTSENNLCLVVNTVFSISEWLKCIAALPSESKSFCLHFAPLAVIHYRLLSPSVTKDTRGIRGCASCVSACHRWFTLNQGENRGLLTRSSKAADVSD